MNNLAHAAIVYLSLLMCAGVANAQQQQATTDTAASGDPFANLPGLQDDALNGATVAAETAQLAISTQNLSATNSGNSVTGDTVETGDINLNADAFSGFDGIGNFVMNTGNNNNLQGAVSVVVTLPPAS